AVLVYNAATAPGDFSLNWNGKTVSYSLPAGAVATLTWAGYIGSTFDVTAGPASQTIAPGGSTAFEIGVAHYGSDHAPVSLQVQGLPADADGALKQIPFTTEWKLAIDSEPNLIS